MVCQIISSTKENITKAYDNIILTNFIKGRVALLVGSNDGLTGEGKYCEPPILMYIQKVG